MKPELKESYDRTNKRIKKSIISLYMHCKDADPLEFYDYFDYETQLSIAETLVENLKLAMEMERADED